MIDIHSRDKSNKNGSFDFVGRLIGRLLARLTLNYLCGMSRTCNFGCFPFLFRGRSFILIASVSEQPTKCFVPLQKLRVRLCT